MTSIELRQATADIPFFQDMTQRELEFLAAHAQLELVERGHYLGVEGKPASCFYAVLSGSVLIESIAAEFAPVPIQRPDVPTVIGYSWLIPPFEWTFDILVTEPGEVIRFDGAALCTRCKVDHEMGCDILTRVMQLVAERLLATRMRLVESMV
jgi:hypothetical protein